MTAENFVYWLQGYLEITEASKKAEKGLDIDQVQVIKNHVDLVLHKVTVNVPFSNPIEDPYKIYPHTIPVWEPYTVCGIDPSGDTLLFTTHTGASARPLC